MLGFRERMAAIAGAADRASDGGTRPRVDARRSIQESLGALGRHLGLLAPAGEVELAPAVLPSIDADKFIQPTEGAATISPGASFGGGIPWDEERVVSYYSQNVAAPAAGTYSVCVITPPAKTVWLVTGVRAVMNRTAGAAVTFNALLRLVRASDSSPVGTLAEQVAGSTLFNGAVDHPFTLDNRYRVQLQTTTAGVPAGDTINVALTIFRRQVKGPRYA